MQAATSLRRRSLTHIEHIVRELARVTEWEELAIDLLELVLVHLARGAVLEEALVLEVSIRGRVESVPIAGVPGCQLRSRTGSSAVEGEVNSADPVTPGRRGEGIGRLTFLSTAVSCAHLTKLKGTLARSPAPLTVSVLLELGQLIRRQLGLRLAHGSGVRDIGDSGQY